MQWILKKKERAVSETTGTEPSSMNSIENATCGLVAAILDTEEYRVYAAELEKVNCFPELKAQIDDFRKRNYLLQMETEIDFNKLDEFEREYQSIRENPLVADFLAAEVDLCRLVQAIQTQLISALHFE